MFPNYRISVVGLYSTEKQPLQVICITWHASPQAIKGLGISNYQDTAAPTAIAVIILYNLRANCAAGAKGT